MLAVEVFTQLNCDDRCLTVAGSSLPRTRRKGDFAQVFSSKAPVESPYTCCVKTSKSCSHALSASTALA